MDSFNLSLACALFHIHRNTAVESLTFMLCLQKSWFQNEVRKSAVLTEVFRSYSLDAGREIVLFETKHGSSPVYRLIFITSFSTICN